MFCWSVDVFVITVNPCPMQFPLSSLSHLNLPIESSLTKYILVGDILLQDAWSASLKYVPDMANPPSSVCTMPPAHSSSFPPIANSPLFNCAYAQGLRSREKG